MYRSQNFSRPVRSPRPDDVNQQQQQQQRFRTASGASFSPSLAESVSSVDELNSRMRASSFSHTSSPHPQGLPTPHTQPYATTPDGRPRHLSLSAGHHPRDAMQRSYSKDSFHSMHSTASSAYVSPTSVQPGPFSSQQQQQQHQHQYQSFAVASSGDESFNNTSEQLAPIPRSTPTRPRANSSVSQSSRRQSHSRRNSRWKSFFSFRSGKDGDEEDSAAEDDDDDDDRESEAWGREPPSPSASHVLFSSKHDTPGIVFSPPNAKNKVVVPLNQASDVDWDELHRRRVAEAETAAAHMREQEGGGAAADHEPEEDVGPHVEHLSTHASILLAGASPTSSQPPSPSPSGPPSPFGEHRPPSLYSNYSYYDLDATVRARSPRSPRPHMPPELGGTSAHALQQQQAQPKYDGSTGGTMAKTKRSMDLLRVPGASGGGGGQADEKKSLSHEDPMDCLHLGIEQHEKGTLERAAYYFERAATLNGGVGSGMLLWGLSLRHGWGVHADPARGFRWIQRAAESVVGDLSGIVSRGVLTEDEHEAATSAARHDLVLAIYELGMCFRQGWGIKKDRKLALMYFELAASLGDADAQQELGFCYLKGKGTKVDKMKAAKFFRLAEAQGIQQWYVPSLCREEEPPKDIIKLRCVFNTRSYRNSAWIHKSKHALY